MLILSTRTVNGLACWPQAAAFWYPSGTWLFELFLKKRQCSLLSEGTTLIFAPPPREKQGLCEWVSAISLPEQLPPNVAPRSFTTSSKAIARQRIFSTHPADWYYPKWWVLCAIFQDWIFFSPYDFWQRSMGSWMASRRRCNCHRTMPVGKKKIIFFIFHLSE